MASKRISLIVIGIIFILVGFYNNSDTQQLVEILYTLGIRGDAGVVFGLIATLGAIGLGAVFILAGLLVSDKQANKNVPPPYYAPQNQPSAYQPPAYQAPTATSKLETELTNLNNMLNKGLIEEDEYKRLREKLLSNS